MKKILMLTAAAMVLTAPAAFAEHEDGHKGSGHHKGDYFEMLDADKDGNVTKAEFLKFHEDRFDEMDTDKNGSISKAESDAKKAEWKEKMRERRAAKKAGEGKAPKAAAETTTEAPAR